MALSKIYGEGQARIGGKRIPIVCITLRKYDYVNVVQGYYGYCGWEHVCTSDKRSEAIANLREYRENEPEYAHRIIRRRVLSPLYTALIQHPHRTTKDGRIVLSRGWEWDPTCTDTQTVTLTPVYESDWNE